MIYSGGCELAGDEVFPFSQVAGMFQTTAAPGAKAHFFGYVINGHALLKTLSQLSAVEVFANTNNHLLLSVVVNGHCQAVYPIKTAL